MMNPTSNKKDFDELSTALKDMAYSYTEKKSLTSENSFLLNLTKINKINKKINKNN